MTLFRNAEISDASELKRLWLRSFGDNDEYIQRFLDHFGYGTGIVCETAGKITGAAYIIPTDGIIFPDGSKKGCSYIYALAVSPEFRGAGLGKELTKAALRFSKEKGNEFAVLKPSSETLFEFYGKIGFEYFSYANILFLEKNKLPPNNAEKKITEVSPAEYIEIREEVLKGIPHIRLSNKQAEYQAKLGKLYGINIFNRRGCAAVEPHGIRVNIKELLIPDGIIAEAAAVIAGEIPSSKYKVTIPVFDKNSAEATGMIYPTLEIQNTIPFLGLAYD